MARPEGSKNKRPSKAVVLGYLADIVGHNSLELAKNVFPETYYPIQMSEGRHVIIRQVDDEGIVVMSTREAVANSVYAYAKTKDEYRDAVPDIDTAKKIVGNWIAVSSKNPMPMPPPFRMKDEKGLTFHRLPWILESGPKPTWEKLLSRLPNSRLFMCWIGSLFVEGSYRQQYVWMYGNGGDGKGCIMRFLRKVFGPAFGSKEPRTNGDKFWTYSMIDKQIVAFTDLDDHKFVSTPIFKQITGEDAVPCEAKGQMDFTAEIKARFIISSNGKPDITSEKSHLRRVIYLAFDERTNPDEDDFEDRLWAEGGHFLHSCIEAYKALGSQGPLPTTGNELSGWLDVVEAAHAETLDFYFTIDKNSTEQGASGVMVQRCLRDSYKTRKEQLNFLAWLERTHGIKNIQVTHGEDKGKWHYKGLFFKSGVSQLIRSLPKGTGSANKVFSE